MRISCPCCGPRDHAEFAYGGDASDPRPPPDDDDFDRWFDHVYLRDNPRGPHSEYWQHVGGCREWLIVRRDTLTHQVHAVGLAAETGDRR